VYTGWLFVCGEVVDCCSAGCVGVVCGETGSVGCVKVAAVVVDVAGAVYGCVDVWEVAVSECGTTTGGGGAR
jgi:hypothetical protein